MPVNKKTNDYTDALGDLYDRIPKAVFAAIAVDYARMSADGLGYDEEIEHAKACILDTWRVLYQAGIVPQKPKQ